MPRLLIIDNYDSFTWNLAHLAASITGEMPTVIRNDDGSFNLRQFDAIIISPGPGHPANRRDFGLSPEIIRSATVPVLGVCLGHQGIALEFGAVIRHVEPAHGQVSRIAHAGDQLFRGVPREFDAVRYHSLAVALPLPPELLSIAWTADGRDRIMALRHVSQQLPGIRGVTFEGEFRLDRQSVMGSATEIVSYRAAGQQLTIARDGVEEIRTQSLFDFLDESLRANRSDLPFPACGGYVGYFGYELRSDCGSPVTHPSPFPDAMLMRVGNTQPTVIRASPATMELHACEPHACTAPQPRLSRSQYLDRIAQCIGYIRDGEAYELCLTNQLDFETDIPALRYYQTLRAMNPGPYSAYLRFGDLEIACSSPECFLRVDREGRVESRPIKGTVPRGRTPEEDASLRAQLATDPRYRAENLMITDLVRNDLGRVAQPGMVRVPGLMEVESYATVHQLVSTIAAQLRPDATVVDCLRAAFPGGSMTGAPKLRAMELLDSLEPTARGIYSGSIGYIGFDGTADLNIVIRTAVFHRGHVSIGAGGAILAQSDPEAEWDETRLKADVLLRAFGIS